MSSSLKNIIEKFKRFLINIYKPENVSKQSVKTFNFINKRRRVLAPFGLILLAGFLWNVNKREHGDKYHKKHELHSLSLLNGVKQSSRARDNFIVDVTRKCAPSVVYIEIKDPRRTIPETGQPITASNGSGFIIREDGWILTNAHVVVNRPQALVMITTSDGVTYKATVKDVDMKTDLALLKIAASKLPALKFGNSGDVNPGEWVVALGSPLSLTHTITAGVISSVNRDAQELGLSNMSMKFIQTDAAITFGHSGGPLVNLDGEVIGINNLRITAGIAFAIPIDYAKEFLAQSSINNPFKEKPMAQNCLGLITLTLNTDVIRQLLHEKNVIPPDLVNGVLVWKLIDGMDAQRAGLEVGDIITHINGNPVHDGGDIYMIISKYEDKTVVFSVLRKGTKKEVFIKL